MARNNKQIKPNTMTKTNTILEKYKESFLAELETACILYKLIGNGTHESPMWFQLYKLKTHENTLCFINSQNSKINFKVEIQKEDSEDLEFDDFSLLYGYFRELKYTYIETNHPTIYTQLK
jgi:hypothetical protein